jgi:hypothetical protein
LTKILHDAHKLCCHQDVPLSCSVLIVQVRAIMNAVDENDRSSKGNY